MEKTKQQAFLRLYEPVHTRFERFCRARVPGNIDHRDLVNDTLLIAFQKYETIRSEKAFLSYLIGTAIRLLANQQRKSKPVVALTSEQSQLLKSGDRADQSADVHLLYKALDRLPDIQKESIILFELTGFSIKEIAALHQASESAVKKRLERGRKKLAELLCQPSVSQPQKA
ncbi:MAG: RNA polymerase sigma factor [Bacteroidota bacterium]